MLPIEVTFTPFGGDLVAILTYLITIVIICHFEIYINKFC